MALYLAGCLGSPRIGPVKGYLIWQDCFEQRPRPEGSVGTPQPGVALLLALRNIDAIGVYLAAFRALSEKVEALEA
jgi:hypothetical protein